MRWPPATQQSASAQIWGPRERVRKITPDVVTKFRLGCWVLRRAPGLIFLNFGSAGLGRSISGSTGLVLLDFRVGRLGRKPLQIDGARVPGLSGWPGWARTSLDRWGSSFRIFGSAGSGRDLSRSRGLVSLDFRVGRVGPRPVELDFGSAGLGRNSDPIQRDPMPAQQTQGRGADLPRSLVGGDDDSIFRNLLKGPAFQKMPHRPSFDVGGFDSPWPPRHEADARTCGIQRLAKMKKLLGPTDIPEQPVEHPHTRLCHSRASPHHAGAAQANLIKDYDGADMILCDHGHRSNATHTNQ